MRGNHHKLQVLNFVALARQRAAQYPAVRAYTFLEGDALGGATLTYEELDAGARAIGALLQQAGATSERVLLLYPPGLSYVTAFMGCLYAGAVAVPAYPPDPMRIARTLPRLEALISDARARFALTQTAIHAMVTALAGQTRTLAELTWLSTDKLDTGLADAWQDPGATRESLALLQYTSGSTGSPRGVMLSHGNLLHNSGAIYDSFEHSDASRGVIWLPPYHDMGLIGGVLQPLWGGFPVVLMSPLDFLRRPFRWLAAISQHRATTSGGPNFAYDLCVRKITPEQRSSLDLSSWDLAFNGAEPIHADTLDRFVEAFAPCGFRRQAFYPCYGLAEGTLIAAGGEKKAVPKVHAFPKHLLERGPEPADIVSEHDLRSLVGCGTSLSDQELILVNPNTRVPVPEGVVGEIWLRGPSVAQGYWDRPEETEETFAARRSDGADRTYLRTGDLGLLTDGELFVTGRIKDLIIIRGRNYYPQDLEQSVTRACPSVRAGCCAAFSVIVEGEERLAIAAEIDAGLRIQGDKTLHQAFAATIREAVAQDHALEVHAVMLLAPHTIPKTSSGKLQRYKCNELYTSGHEHAMAVVIMGDASLLMPASHSRDGDRWPERDALARTAPDERQTKLLGFIHAHLARLVPARAGELGESTSVFALGLDSLRMIEVQSELEAVLGVSLPAAFLWQHPTPAAMAEYFLGIWGELAPAGGHEPVMASQQGSPVAADEEMPLSSGQRRLWFLDQLIPQTPIYNMLFGLRLTGPLDREVLARSMDALVEHHTVLRTVYVERDGQSFARIQPVETVALPMSDLGGMPEPERETHLATVAREFGRKPFVLDKGPLLRTLLVRLGNQDHLLLVAMHHSITDGWSIRLLASDLAATYDALSRGVQSPLTRTQRPQHMDFVRWEAARLASIEAQQAFWSETLAELPRLELPTGRAPAHATEVRGETLVFSLPEELCHALARFGERHECTLFVTLLAAYAILLHRYSGQEDFGIGTVVANRPAMFREVAGFLANTLILRCRPTPEDSVAALVAALHETTAHALARAELPFEKVVSLMQGARGGDQQPLLQVALLVENLGTVEHTAGGLRWQPWMDVPDGSVRGTAKFDLTLMLDTSQVPFAAAFEYRTDLFDADMIARMTGHLETVLRAMVATPEVTLAKLPLLTAAEHDKIVEEWNRTDRALATTACVHELFERQVDQEPDRKAVIFGDRELSYRELDERANRLAWLLRARNVGPGSVVGVCVPRSLDMMATLLGVLKAGAAYLPLDPDYPASRLRFMVEDAGAALVVGTSETLAALAPYSDALAVDNDSALASAPDTRLSSVPECRASTHDLMYVIYTSGSTGRPKGVLVPHRNVLNLLEAMDEHLGDGARAVWLALTSISFDISVLELFWPLSRGGTVVIQEDPSALLRRRPARRTTRTMDFGLFYFADDADARMGRDRYRLLLDGARFGDAHGFSSVWTPERHFHSFGGLYPNPSVTGAALAAVTERIGIRAGSVVLPLHHPVRVAEEWSLVDNLSNGRAGIALASGWHAGDFVFAPERYQDRRAVMLEGIETIRALWRGASISYRGGDGQEVEVELRPRPTQAELPIWLTAAGSAATFETAGTIGANVLTHLLGQSFDDLAGKLACYRQAWASAGHPGRGRVTLMLHTFVGSDPDQIRPTIEQPFRKYLKSSADLMRNLAHNLGLAADATSLAERDLEILAAHAFDRYVETNGLFGTPESCVALVERLAELGVDELACLIDFGIAPDIVLKNLANLDRLRHESNPGAEPIDNALVHQLRVHGVTHMQCTPSYAQLLALDPETMQAMSNLDVLLIGGETFPPALAQTLGEHVRGRVLNMYGPTETTIWSTAHPVENTTEGVPIGRPLANNRIYVLNRHMQPTPIGIPGEIYIGGDGVARGYHTRPALTAERFVPDPFNRSTGDGAGQLYRTGDLARWRSDGVLEFLGRVDHQVKLRGVRIEPGEIERILESNPAVRSAVVIVREDTPGDQRLVAYVVLGRAEPSTRPDVRPAALQAFLREHLPDVMVPSVIEILDALPYTPNGKIARAALPAPRAATNADSADNATPMILPRNQVERTLAEIWASVLGVERIGIHDNFFDRGGHSLLMVQVHARIKAALLRDVPLVKLFEYPTISALASHLSHQQPAVAGPAEDQRTRGARQRESLLRQRRLAKPRGNS
jgi:natural product biosynthesis luciferase-like monooxygenase protein